MINLLKNVGLIDQIVRALIVLDLIIPCVLGLVPGALAYPMIGIALVLVVTCVTGHCWLYGLLNLSTWQPAGL